MNDTELKLAAARTRLILDKPFLGALVLRLPMCAVSEDWCPTTATDARQFYYNPAFIDALSVEETQFMLAHEALHCALSHFARREHRVKHRWDLACDLAINPLLLDENLRPPPNILSMEEYKGMTAEEIYPLLSDNEDQETLDRHVYDQENEADQDDRQESGKGAPRNKTAEQDDRQSGGADAMGQPPPLSLEEKETLAVQWQQRMAGAAQQALQSGQHAGLLARMIDHLLQPQLPWRMLLARYLTAAAHDDFSYLRPSRREGDAILPSLHSHLIDIGIAVDTSGSVSDREITDFLAEVSAIKGQMRARITLLPCDSEIPAAAPWIIEPWEELRLPDELTGGGGTDFRPVFEWFTRQAWQPTLLVYFTDAQGSFPELEPAFPVIWLVKGKTKVPWGQRIQLN